MAIVHYNHKSPSLITRTVGFKTQRRSRIKYTSGSLGDVVRPSEFPIPKGNPDAIYKLDKLKKKEEISVLGATIPRIAGADIGTLGAGAGAGCRNKQVPGSACRYEVPGVGAGAGQSQPAAKVPGAGCRYEVPVRVNRHQKCRVPGACMRWPVPVPVPVRVNRHQKCRVPGAGMWCRVPVPEPVIVNRHQKCWVPVPV